MHLLRRHDFAMIWWAGLLAYIGNSMVFVVLPIWVWQEYRSATLVSVVTLMSVLPPVVLGSVAGIFVDRWRRPRVMLVTTLVRLGLLLLLAVGASLGWLWLILLVRFGTAAAMQFFGPAEASLLPRLVEGEDELVRANSLNQLNDNLGSGIGLGLGGILLVWVGLEGIALVMAALTALGALLLVRIRYHDQRAVAEITKDPVPFSPAASARRLVVEWRDGMALFVRNPAVRILFVVIGVASISNVGFTTLLSVFALETLGVDVSAVGLIFMAGSIGGMLGALALGALPARWPVGRLFQGSILAFAVLDALFYGYPLATGGVLMASLTIAFLKGLPTAGINATAMTLFQTRVPEHLLGRALGSLGSLVAILMLIATPIAGVLADAYSAQAVLLGITLAMAVSWVLALRLDAVAPEIGPVPADKETSPEPASQTGR